MLNKIFMPFFLIAFIFGASALGMECFKKRNASLRSDQSKADFLESVRDEVEVLHAQNKQFWQALTESFHEPSKLEDDAIHISNAIATIPILLAKVNQIKRSSDRPIRGTELKKLQKRMKQSLIIYNEFKNLKWVYSNRFELESKQVTVYHLFDRIPSNPSEEFDGMFVLAQESEILSKEVPELKDSALRQLAIAIIKSSKEYKKMKRTGWLNNRDQMKDPTSKKTAWVSFY